MRVGLVAALLLVVSSGTARAGTTYYVSAAGNDRAAGTSPAAAWRTVARVDRAPLRAGDRVLFRGGDEFRGRVLIPRGVGRAGARLRFASYGSGQANLAGGIALRSTRWIAISNLKVDPHDWNRAGNFVRGVLGTRLGAGTTHVSIVGCTFLNVSIGVQSANRHDAHWLVRGNRVQYTRDSGVLISDSHAPNLIGGSDMLFEGNTILDTGLDSARIPYPKHGIYSVGTSIVFRRNTIRRFSGAGLSLRARNQTVEANAISGGEYGVVFSPYDPVAGTTRILRNEISNLHASGIEVNAFGRVENRESFVIVGNTIAHAASGVRVLGTKGSTTITGNTFAGP